MKILHILDHSLPLHSGYTFRSQNIFKAQRKMGYQPVILTSPKHEATWKGDWAEKETIGEFTYYRTGAINNSSIPAILSTIMVNIAVIFPVDMDFIFSNTFSIAAI